METPTTIGTRILADSKSERDRAVRGNSKLETYEKLGTRDE